MTMTLTLGQIRALYDYYGLDAPDTSCDDSPVLLYVRDGSLRAAACSEDVNEGTHAELGAAAPPADEWLAWEDA